MNTATKNMLALICVIAAVVVIAIVSSSVTLSAAHTNGDAEIYFGGNREIQERFERLNEIYETVIGEYYTEVDPDVLIQGAIDGMLESLDDPYTFYYTPEEMTSTMEEREGVYHGIGILVSNDWDGNLIVARVFKNSPAQKAGLYPSDIITHVDGTPVSAATTEDMNNAVSLVKGTEGSSVLLTILRGNETLEIYVLRGSVNINRVEYQILDGNIGYLALYEFFGDAVSGVKEALDAFEKADVQGIIFDVRNNTGGELQTCLNITDQMVPEGLIMYMEDRYGNRNSYYSNDYYFNRPMVVLINEMTASASEVFAGAVQDYGVGTLVGTNSFGKGIVQTVITFDDDSAGMQLTTSQYYTPKGRSLHKVGVQPDIVVEMDEDYNPAIYTPDLANDNQLEVAYNTLLDMIESQ